MELGFSIGESPIGRYSGRRAQTGFLEHPDTHPVVPEGFCSGSREKKIDGTVRQPPFNSRGFHV
jgi:hypothetical protein